MTDLVSELNGRVERIAMDRGSGAADLLDDALDVLRRARDGGVEIASLARALCRTQPSMAPLWNAAIDALASHRDPGRLDRFARRVARSAEALTRFAAGVFDAQAGSEPLHLVTLSASRSVRTVIEAIRQGGPIRDEIAGGIAGGILGTVRVSCAEGRPGLEGRRLAAQLAAAGIPVTIYGDAALAQALGDAGAVLVGADAVGPTAFLNKSGTRMLAAAATQQGVPLYVVATRDKFVAPHVWAHLSIREEPAAEIWEAAPPGVQVRNAYFESTPLDLVTAVISDVGILGAGMVPQVCEALADPIARDAFAGLIA